MKLIFTTKANIIIGAMVLTSLLGIGGGIYLYKNPHLWKKGSVSEGTPQKQLWTCSMHPQVLKNEPGKCPICFMDLVKVKSHNHKQKTTAVNTTGTNMKKMDPNALLIRVEPTVIQKMGVRTEILKKAIISREIRAVAHIDFNEESQVMINSRVNGWVEKLYARYTGKTVRRGQALAGIYSPELVSTQEEYLQLYNKLKENADSPEMKELLKAARKRLRYWNISESQIKRIEESGKVSRLLTLYSPYAGVLVEKKVVQGARIKVGMDLFKVVDLATVWAFVHISEKDIPFVKRGMPVEMRVPQVPGKIFKGRVSFIFPYLDAKARDLKVRVSFRNRRFQLRPGMYANLQMKRTLKEKFLVAPSSSVIRTGTRELAFVYKGEGIFEPREVRTGVMSSGDNVQILEGLKEGEAVVVSGQFLLDSETRIQEAVRKMRNSGNGGGGMPGGHNH